MPPYQFVAILESVLAKISRYDEGTLFSSFLSFTVRMISYPIFNSSAILGQVIFVYVFLYFNMTVFYYRDLLYILKIPYLKGAKKNLLHLEGTFYSFQVKAASKYVEVPVSIKNSLIFLPNLSKSILRKTNFFSFSDSHRNQGWMSRMAM